MHGWRPGPPGTGPGRCPPDTVLAFTRGAVHARARAAKSTDGSSWGAPAHEVRAAEQNTEQLRQAASDAVRQRPPAPAPYAPGPITTVAGLVRAMRKLREAAGTPSLRALDESPEAAGRFARPAPGHPQAARRAGPGRPGRGRRVRPTRAPVDRRPGRPPGPRSGRRGAHRPVTRARLQGPTHVFSLAQHVGPGRAGEGEPGCAARPVALLPGGPQGLREGSFAALHRAGWERRAAR